MCWEMPSRLAKPRCWPQSPMGSATRPWRAEAAVVEAARMASVLSTALERAFGHINMGVYAEVMAGGEIAVAMR